MHIKHRGVKHSWADLLSKVKHRGVKHSWADLLLKVKHTIGRFFKRLSIFRPNLPKVKHILARFFGLF